MSTLLAPPETLRPFEEGLARPPVDAGVHVGLARYIARQFRHQGAVCGFDLDDLTGEASIALVHASQTFVPARGVPFKSYGGRVIRNYLINLLSRRRLRPADWRAGERGHFYHLPARPGPDRDSREEVERLLRVLQHRERLVVELRFGIDRPETPTAEIADYLDVSVQRVGQIIERALARMRAAAERDDHPTVRPA